MKFKLVKLTIAGEKIGYYNTNLNPEDSWPTKNVDLAQLLSEDEVKSVMTIEKMKEKYFNTSNDYQIHQIEC